jgi:hypothetical protein
LHDVYPLGLQDGVPALAAVGGMFILSNMTRFFQNWQIVFQAPRLQVGLQAWQKRKSPDTLEEPRRR